jgi:hypothetical protein
MGEATETAMSRRLNWERANLNKKAKLSLSDEREFMERDRAARWLEHQEQRRQGKSEFDEGQSKSRHGGTARKHRR